MKAVALVFWVASSALVKRDGRSLLSWESRVPSSSALTSSILLQLGKLPFNCFLSIAMIRLGSPMEGILSTWSSRHPVTL